MPCFDEHKGVEVFSHSSVFLPNVLIDHVVDIFLSLPAPLGSRLVLSLLGYSLLPHSSSLDQPRLDATLKQIGDLLSQTTNVDPLHDEHDPCHRGSLDDFELGRMLGYGCNAAVYEARLRSTSGRTFLHYPPESTISDDASTDSDIEILSRQSSFYEDALESEEQLNELTFKEGMYNKLEDLLFSICRSTRANRNNYVGKAVLFRSFASSRSFTASVN